MNFKNQITIIFFSFSFQGKIEFEIWLSITIFLFASGKQENLSQRPYFVSSVKLVPVTEIPLFFHTVKKKSCISHRF